MKHLRYLDPKGYDRVSFLEKNSNYTPYYKKYIEKTLKVINITKSKEKFQTLMGETEAFLVKQSNYNIIIKNIPMHAELSEVPIVEKVTHRHLRDTFNKFGTFNALDIIQNNLYIQFRKHEDAKNTHKSINGMCMGKNILSSECY